MERVVVTGIGVVSSVGTGKDDFWKALLSGKSGISPVRAFDASGLTTRVGGEVSDFRPEDYLSAGAVKEYGRASQMATAAAKLAVRDSGLELTGGRSDLRPVDVIVGTTMGESQTLEKIDTAWLKSGEDEVLADTIRQYPGNVLALSISKELDLKGLSIVIPTACSAGNYAIGYGYDLIKTGQSRSAIAGGADAFSRVAFSGFSRMFAMASAKCCPFDKKREGMLLGEGAGFVVLESYSAAKARGARVYAEILGYGLSCDAYHMTIPSEEGMVNVIQKAVKSSGIRFEEVDYISAHGTGTPMNDKTESKAINRIFGERARKVPVSSIKSMLGHTMGAASAMEAIACALAIREGRIPPTINFENPDEECSLDCVPNVCREQTVRVALNNSYAFGGNNACLVLGRCP